MTLKHLGKGVGYTLFLAFITLFFVYFTFPMEKVRAFAAFHLSNATGAKVNIEELDVSDLSKVEVWGVEKVKANG